MEPLASNLTSEPNIHELISPLAESVARRGLILVGEEEMERCRVCDAKERESSSDKSRYLNVSPPS
jgi:hypothetical protein